MFRIGWLFSDRLVSPACAVLLGAAVVLASSACSASPEPTQSGPQPQRGGTLYLLVSADETTSQGMQFESLDPSIVYKGADLAFFSATLMRALVSYTYSPDPETANTLQPDLASDTGTPNADATQWTFKLRDGPKWQDGTPITCADIKYGISREFAVDVLGGGPNYTIQYLDIPTEADGSSAYKGPYHGTGQALFDQAVSCDGNTITFHLNRPVVDFNYATTWGMFPVKRAVDTGPVQPTADGSPPPDFLSSGPYQIKSYTTGIGGKMILERNPYWDPGSDPVRKALPDNWEVDFGLDPVEVDQRLMASTGADAMALMYGGVQTYNLATIFADPHTANPDFAGRAFSAYTPFVNYVWINTQKVPNVLQRQAIAVALDRGALREGGAFGGEVADGVIPPNLGIEYAPTGWADDLFGEAVPPAGNPDLARRLIEQSGEPMPDLTFDYHQGPVPDAAADIVINSLARAGINVTANPIPGLSYWGAVLNDDTADEFGIGPWGADWPNASTIIPLLFTDAGGWNLSRVRDDQDFLDQVQDALTTLDRGAQAAKWQSLNKQAMQRAYAIPLTFVLSQTLGGTRVGPLYPWAPCASWPYAEMGVLPE